MISLTAFLIALRLGTISIVGNAMPTPPAEVTRFKNSLASSDFLVMTRVLFSKRSVCVKVVSSRKPG
jgi:hypothetical protein